MIDGGDILVTGATGSFGRRFVETVLARHRPRRLIVFSRDELKQSEMRERLGEDRHPCLRYFIGDVRDVGRLRRAMQGVDAVVHAAALKQVPACEYNPMEAILTNVIGARNVIDAALDAGVKKVLALSTDKAVSPANLYGATKLCAEKLFVQSNAYAGASGTRFACVRYGNVVGSRGSVVPLFLRQRDQGEITVTDGRMTRFWITLEQGVEFVLGCLGRMAGGEVFVPKLPSMSVVALAAALAPGVPVRDVGIRPGEKLHEVLVSEDEARTALEQDEMFIVLPGHPWWGAGHPHAGRPLPDGFRYSSDTNPRRLTAEELRAMVGGLP